MTLADDLWGTGFKVLEATNADEAMRVLRSSDPARERFGLKPLHIQLALEIRAAGDTTESFLSVLPLSEISSFPVALLNATTLSIM
jgi:hypothetical protein